MKIIFATLMTIGISCAIAAPALSASIQGAVIMTRSSPTAELLWDATPRVFAVVNAGGSDESHVRSLEADAVQILRDRTAKVHASSIELQVIYQKNPVAAQYGTPSMANKNKILLLRASTAAVRAHSAQWISDLQAGKNPAGLTIKVEGRLPH